MSVESTIKELTDIIINKNGFIKLLQELLNSMNIHISNEDIKDKVLPYVLKLPENITLMAIASRALDNRKQTVKILTGSDSEEVISKSMEVIQETDLVISELIKQLLDNKLSTALIERSYE